MIPNHEKFRFIDENKETEFFIEVNWNAKDKKTNECKLLRFIFPDGKTALIKKDVFIAFLFAIGNMEEQKKLIPEIHQQVKWYETVVSIKAKRDIFKGENITFPIKLSLPAVEEEVLKK